MVNYYEHRLSEIAKEISLLQGRPDCKDYIEDLKVERQQILNNLKYLD